MEERPGRLRTTGECGVKSQGVKGSFRKEVNGRMPARGLCEVRTETCPLDRAAWRLLVIYNRL